MEKTSRHHDVSFDLSAAREIVDAFSLSCGVNCKLFSAEGVLLHERNLNGSACAFCHKLFQVTGGAAHCEQVHLYGAYQAERFGGRYIYFCPSGMAYCSSPIIVGGRTAGSLVGGPVLIMDPEDYLAGDTPAGRVIPHDALEQFRPVLDTFPRMEPARLSHLSALLFAASVYVGDSSHALFLQRGELAQQQDIGTYLQQLKNEGAAPAYPIEKERALVTAITEGDQSTARRLLNELLGHILFSTGGDFTLMRARALELMVVLSRAAADGGGDLDQIFGLNCRYLSEIDRLRSSEDLVFWLTRVMERFTDLVFDLVDIKHKDVIYKAIDYMKCHYPSKITLESTAGYVGLSPSYFSKVFKEEMGCTFSAYLNELRIDRSKALLLAGSASIMEICAQVGFDDQSYFTKVFKKQTGVTPAKFRSRRGRLAADKERPGLPES